MKLDIGCGKNKKEGFTGLDSIAFEGVDVVHDITQVPWPIEDNSVEEVNCSHVLEHLTNFGERWERVKFFNELHRIMKVGAKATLVFPHWASNRYYGDPTHKEPFSEMGFYYLNKEWRMSQAPHADSEHTPNGYSCDFDATWGYSMHPSLAVRNAEYQQFACSFYKEAVQDIHATITKKG